MASSPRTRVVLSALPFALGLLSALVISSASEAPHAQAQGPRKPQTHALLIGVTRYPNLKGWDLEGPVNDVALMRRTLVERYGVDPTRIRELAGWPADATRRPTRGNIEREFERLAKTAARGDQVMILFAGHGSQQPDNDPAGADEDDGKDEIILPADAGDWDETAGHVRNAIADDDIRSWITAIRNQGAFVWAVFDACQSSTLTRGVVTERQRLVPMEVLVPAAVREKMRAGTRGAAGTESGMVGLQGNAAGIAALYAAQTIEPTPEKALPHAKGPVHGLFTYTLVEVLEQSTTPMTYRDLAERVIDRYRALGRIGPTPGFEGGGLDNHVLGAAAAWSGPRLLVGEKHPEKGLQLRAGSIAGLTRGTILAIYPRAGATNPDRVIGHVAITDVDPTSATIQPVEFSGMPAPDPARLITDSRGRVVQFDYGEHVLRVAAAPNSPSSIARALAAIGADTNGLAEQAPIDAAEWIIQVAGDDVILAPSSGWQIDPARGAAPDEAHAPLRIGKASSADLTAQLARVLNAISRARNLLRLGASREPAAAEVEVAIELLRFKDQQDAAGTVVPVDETGRILRVGDQIAFRLRNTGKASADVTLLFVDSRYGIQPLFPRVDREAESRLKPDADVLTGRFNVRADTIGSEQVVAIAVVASPNAPRADFRYLAQPTLEAASATRSAGASTREAMRGGPAGGLQRLLDRAMYGSGGTRSLADAEVGRHAVKMLAWKTAR